MNHSRWQRDQEIQAEREEIRLLIALGRAVRDRRREMGLSESGLADRLGIASLDEIEGIEQGDPEAFHPTLLPRLTHALQAELRLRLTPDGTADAAFTHD